MSVYINSSRMSSHLVVWMGLRVSRGCWCGRKEVSVRKKQGQAETGRETERDPIILLQPWSLPPAEMWLGQVQHEYSMQYLPFELSCQNCRRQSQLHSISTYFESSRDSAEFYITAPIHVALYVSIPLNKIREWRIWLQGSLLVPGLGNVRSTICIVDCFWMNFKGLVIALNALMAKS